jgi:adenylate kinase
MIIALTGTPGTGKSTVAGLLMKKGFKIKSIEKLARGTGAKPGKDRTLPVDIKAVSAKLKDKKGAIALVVGHLAHLLPNDVCIVLRCNPNVLRERLAGRKYPVAKVRHNVEAEAIDLILTESLERNEKVYEIDTTTRTPENVAEAIEAILSGNTEGYEAGKIDWGNTVLSWY